MRKTKARFCVRSDTQIAGVDNFNTYALVVKRTTVQMVLFLSQVIYLNTKQAY